MDDSQSEPSDPSQSGSKPLSSREAVEFTGRIAEFAGAGLPLPPGLRAAAADLPDDRLAAAMAVPPLWLSSKGNRWNRCFRPTAEICLPI